MSEPATIQINGRKLSLSDDRSVWAGKADDGSWYFHFENGDLLTKLHLSQEALDALYRLTRNEAAELIEQISVLRFVYKMKEMEWSQVREAGEASEVSDDR